MIQNDCIVAYDDILQPVIMFKILRGKCKYKIRDSYRPIQDTPSIDEEAINGEDTDQHNHITLQSFSSSKSMISWLNR